MIVAGVVAGDGEDDNVRIDSRRREFPDAQASPVTRSSRRVTAPVTRSAPLSRARCAENAEENQGNNNIVLFFGTEVEIEHVGFCETLEYRVCFAILSLGTGTSPVDTYDFMDLVVGI